MNLFKKIHKKVISANTFKTAEINKSSDSIDQIKTLNKLLSKASKTEFGKKHYFRSLLVQKNNYESFKKIVPIYNYESFYQAWIIKMLSDQLNVSWPGLIKYYAMSSGTTEGNSKFIPISKNYIKTSKNITSNLFFSLYSSGQKISFTKNSILTIGGSSQLNKEKQHYNGDLSGIFARNRPIWSKFVVKPNLKITNLQDWNIRIKAIVLEAPKWNIEVIIGNIAWVQYLIEKIIQHHKIKNIQQIWPKLNIIISGGIFIESYIPYINQYSTKSLNFINTYIASEGFFALQHKNNYNQFKFNLKNGIFFEFAEYNSTNFTAEGNLKENPRTMMIHRVETNKEYSIVISTNSGLWRYHLGDLIRFIDTKEHIFEIIGRTKQCLTDIGEHLTLEEINIAVKRASLLLKFHVLEFTVLSVTTKNEYEHHWYLSIESKNKVSQDMLEHCLDSEIMSLNEDYSTLRKSLIKRVNIHLINKQVFYNWLSSRGKLNGQAKIPRIMSGSVKDSWLEFISNTIDITNA